MKKTLTYFLVGFILLVVCSFFQIGTVYAEVVNPWTVYRICGDQTESGCTEYIGATAPYQATMPIYISDMINLDYFAWYFSYDFQPNYEYKLQFSLTNSEFTASAEAWRSIVENSFVQSNGVRVSYDLFNWAVTTENDNSRVNFSINFSVKAPADYFSFELRMSNSQYPYQFHRYPLNQGTNLFWIGNIAVDAAVLSQTDLKLEEIKGQIGSITDSIDGTNDKIDQTNKELDNINSSITDSSIDDTSSKNFFNNFKDNDHGLSSVITAPLQFIKNLNNNTCNPIDLTVPFVDKPFQLPCMSTVYQSNFGSFFTLYQTITTGFIAYYVSVRIFALVKGFKDPKDDRIEVMDL